MSLITSTAEAERAIDDMTALLEKLYGLLQQETTLVHAGRIRSAAEIEPAKTALAGQLFVSGERLKANTKFLLQAAPARCATLRSIQEAFRAVLQKNMIVLATAHAVSEAIVRRLSSDLARKAAPQVYGASGRATAPNAKHMQPLALSRKL
jgi:flagellar biosynthesis/type III secretory pathway chaperone